MSHSEEEAHAARGDLSSFCRRLRRLSDRLWAAQRSPEAPDLDQIMSEIDEAANELRRIELLHSSYLDRHAQRDRARSHTDEITLMVNFILEQFAYLGPDRQKHLNHRARKPLSNGKTCKERATDAYRAAQDEFGQDVTYREAYEWAKTQTCFGAMAPNLDTFKRYLRGCD